MKKILLAFLSLACFQVEAQTLYPSGVLNCIARYDFSTSQSTITNLPDVSGNMNNSSLVQNLTPTTSWRNLPNKAMQFNGTSSYALIPNSNSLTPPVAVTIVSLVKFNGYYNGDCQFSQVISKGYPGYISGQYGLAVTDDVFDGACSNFDENHQQLIGIFNNSYYTPGMIPNPGNYVSKGKWYFMAICYNGSNIKYYQLPMDTAVHYNNISAIFTSPAFNSPIGANNQDVSIGKHLNPIFPYWFNGKMDEVALFNTFLSPSEMQSVYDYLWGVLNVDASFTKTSFCQGGTFQLPFSINANNAFQAGNVITVQLSDANGNFNAPINIGSAVATASGVIGCTIPGGTPAGNNYKVRLAASMPYEFSEVYPVNLSVMSSAALNTAVTITANPGTSINAGQSVTFTAAVTNGGVSPDFQWKKNGSDIVGAIASTYSTSNLVDNDVISVLVTTNDACENSVESNTMTMSVSTGIKNTNDIINSLSFYPNPNNGSFSIVADTKNNNPFTLEIRNILGQLFYTTTLSPKQGIIDQQITISAGIAAGNYFMILRQSDTKLIKPIIIKRN